MTLRAKLSLSYIGLAVLLAGVFVAFSSWLVREGMMEEESEYFEDLTRTLATTAAPAIATHDYGTLRRFVASVRESVHVRSVAIVDRDRRILAHSRPGRSGKRLRAGIPLPEQRIRRQRIGEDGSAVRVVAPLVIGDKVWGGAVITFSRAELLGKIRRANLTILGAGLLTALGASLLGLSLARRFLGPVQRLTATAEDLGRGELDRRADPERRDELGTLAVTFNQMADSLQQSYRALERAKEDWERSFNAVSDPMFLHDEGYRIIRCNRAYLEVAGRELAEVVGRPYFEVFPRLDGPLAGGRELREVVGEAGEEVYFPEGDRFFHAKFFRVDGEEGEYLYTVHILEDITEYRRARTELARRNRALRALSACDHAVVHATEEAGLAGEVCRIMTEEVGYRLAWLGYPGGAGGTGVRLAARKGPGLSFLGQPGGGEDRLLVGPVAEALAKGEPALCRDMPEDPGCGPGLEAAAEKGLRSILALPLNGEGRTLGVLVLYAGEPDAFDEEEKDFLGELADDLAHGIVALRTRRRRETAERELYHRAYHDGLTGLPNREYFLEALREAVEDARSTEAAVGVVSVDLDEFKMVNDSLGHEAGDHLLQQVGRRLGEALEDGVVVARHGGDEFLILLGDLPLPRSAEEEEQNGPGPAERAIQVVEQVRQAMYSPFQVQGQDTYIGATMGVSLYPLDAGNAQALLQHADAAIFRAKELGRGSFQFFSQEMSHRQQARLSMANRLHQALARQEFFLLYQPIVELASGRMVGVEALLRWEPDGEPVSPGEFIPVAEETGLILPLGEWVLEEACRQLGEWEGRGIPVFGAVNLSVRQLREAGLVEKVRAALSRNADPARQPLELEITESAMVTNARAMEDLLFQLRDAGLRLSLDDFGTGYSSLDRLKHLPFDKLKVDKSFVGGLPSEEDDTSIVTAIVHLAKNLGLHSLAEGIETEEQYRYLRWLGCEYGQGFLFSHPLPPGEIEALWERGGRLDG